MKRRLLKLLAAAVVVIAFAITPAAFAQDSSETGYAGAGGGAASDVAGVGDPAGGDALPFTGLDLLLMVGGAGILAGTGVLMGRLVARERQG